MVVALGLDLHYKAIAESIGASVSQVFRLKKQLSLYGPPSEASDPIAPRFGAPGRRRKMTEEMEKVDLSRSGSTIVTIKAD